MYKYTITFSAKQLDESAIRGLLEKEHAVNECSISRRQLKSPKIEKLPTHNNADPAPTPPRWGTSKSLVSEVFKDGLVHKSKEVQNKFPEIARSYITKILDTLLKEGHLKRVGHGLYQSTQAEPPTDRDLDAAKEKARKLVTGRENPEILEFLEEPRRPAELIPFLGVSRQRVDQILKSLVRKKLVHRGTHDGHSWTYCTDKTLLKEAVAERALNLGNPAQAILAAMPDAPVFLEDIKLHVGLDAMSARRGLDELDGRGFIELMTFMRRVLVRLTDIGMQSTERGPEAMRAARSDLLSVCGKQRSSILHILDIMGDLPTRRIRVALRGLHPKEDLAASLGQLIQRYAQEGLIDVRDPSVAHPDRHLTDKGKALVDLLRPQLTPLSRQDVERASKKAARIESTRRKEMKVKRTGSSLGKRSMNVLDVLSNEGALTQKLIYERMSDPHKNPRSLDLTMKALHERHLVTRRTGSSIREILWSITVLGRNLLAKNAETSSGSTD